MVQQFASERGDVVRQYIASVAPHVLSARRSRLNDPASIPTCLS
jgi:hypothetical protein